MLNEWAYYLLAPGGAAYRVENGMIVAIGDHKPLEHSPIGWDDLSLAWERSTEKYGLTRSFTLPLGFVIEGQSILTYLNWKNNFEQQIYLLINRRTLYIDTNEYYFWHKFFYKGELDFSTYNYDDENAKATINVMEGGLSKQLNANWDTVYEIPCDQKLIKNDGVNLHKGVKYTIPGPTEENPEGITVSNNVMSEFAVPTATLATDGEAAGVFLQDQIFEQVANHFPYLSSSSNYILKIDDDFGQTVDINIRGTIKVTCLTGIPTGAELQLRMLKQDGVGFAGVGTPSGTGIPFTPSENFTAGHTYSYDFDYTGTLNPGDKIFIIAFLFTTVTAAVEIKIQFAEGTDFSVNFATQQLESIHNAIDLITLYKRIGANISGSEDDWTSDLLVSRQDILVSCGDAIRGIVPSVIKTSMKQFFNSSNVILNCGIGIESNKVVLEEKAHFFQTDNPIYLGQIKKYKDRWATDSYIYNTLKIGYPDVNLENVNGRFAFNTSYLYSSPIKRVVKQLALISDYGADPFEIEITRITGVSTTDSTRDNKNFFIQVGAINEDGQYPLLRQGWTITGVPDPATIYNVGLSVRRLIDVHANWLAGVFSGFDTEELKFETTQYNRSLVANALQEDAPISIASLGAPIYRPIYFDFQSPFIPSDDLTMNSIFAYKENNEWLVSGGDPNDTSNPYAGSKAIKVTSNISPSTTLVSPDEISFSILNEVNFYLKLGAAVPPPTLLRVQFIKGTVTARSVNASFSRSSIAYQNIIANSSSFQVIDSTITSFDRIRINLIALGGNTMYIDNVQISINPQTDLTGIMDENPNRCFSFLHPNGKLLKGHSIKVGAAPNTEQEQGFLLLATGDTDLNDLII